MKDDILKFVEKFYKKHGHAPNQSEIAEGLETSRQRIAYHFKQMGSDLKKYAEYKRFFPLTKAK